MIQAKIIRLIKLNDEYESCLRTPKGKLKKDYIGKKGVVLSMNITTIGNYSSRLFDVKFGDGAKFCLERNQFEWVD